MSTLSEFVKNLLVDTSTVSDVHHFLVIESHNVLTYVKSDFNLIAFIVVSTNLASEI